MSVQIPQAQMLCWSVIVSSPATSTDTWKQRLIKNRKPVIFNITLGYGGSNADGYRIALSKGSTAVTINRQQSYCSTRATVRRGHANYTLGLALRN